MTCLRLLIVALFMAIASSTFAADSSSGCGLGWQIFPKNTLVSSSLRSTTHAFLPNTFSMTSGTSGCAKHEIVMNEKKAIHFAEANHHELMIDMAKGQGEYLNGFALVTGFHGEMKDFGAFVQHNYSKIYTNSKTTPVEMVHNFSNLF